MNIKKTADCIGYCLICFCLLSTPCLFTIKKAQAEIVDRIVAVVNDDIISLFELNSIFLPYAEKVKSLDYSPEQKKEMLFKVREDIINQLIDQKLTDQEIRQARISVSKAEIDNSIERIKESNYYTDEDLAAALKREGYTLEDYRERLKEQILRSKLVNLEVKSKIIITKEDIKAYYDSHAEEFQGEKKYHLKNILMTVPSFASEQEKLDIKKRMELIREQIKAGKSFEAMAKKYSQSSLASEGGDLGTFSYKDIAPKLQLVLDGLAQGDITPVLDTEQGFQIFYIQEFIKERKKTLQEAEPEIEEKLFNEIVNKKFKSWLSNLRNRSHIKIVR
ncbi:Chaperone (peptidyl-prolyl cis-trans isomerase) [Desulfonema limicola]|uniref:Chaperone (Peptidyl-prolyl cis-trans isomerase) n=1 Tax=Desulfonema limicola TaxID=45656 RepID=A0A975B5E2_9BACT|nr:peptidylprolyl isomerase [Desulfonema limicola]QTA79087.1 Chaperone (peptidyl-prolyl cis-trans isomerase) [Desulfonema limicola]